ncbi:zinc finger and SCAN domain-containing protein 12-like isoform X5 [Spodoptera litura]|uniref:Zinc finger and SCAN domain-containing protein 12-like isoform X5 n=1 Tax=Spodoptera litura TaxID=69820 RepID=A0A9J7IPV5_SPOLT|nr:zinc finger and SCAN domain-containing protein 12-like isoform X5 [Spodoptera litura]
MDPKTTDWRAGPNVCRCCLAEGCYKDISTEYFWMGKREVYAEMLSETLNLSIAYSNSGGPNSNSRLICELCISRLRDASDFKRQVQECERTFLRHLDPGSSSMVGEVEVTVEPTEIDPDVKLEHVKQEKAVSDDDDDFDERCGFDEDDDDDLDDQPLTRLASRIPKKESVDLLDLLDNTKATEKRKSSSKTKTVPAKKAKTIKKDVKATSSKAPVKTEKKKKGEAQTGSVRLVETRAEIRSKIAETKRNFTDDIKARTRHATILLEFTRICPFKWMKNLYMCFYCNQQYSDPTALRAHNEEHGFLTTSQIKYALSKLKKYELVKADITNVGCKLCDDYIPDFPTLKWHLLEKHKKHLDPKSGDGVLPFKITLDNFSCALCLDKYTEFKSLNQHMNVHFQNFICEQCGTGFITPERLRTHAFSHETGSFPCENCDKIFRSSNARNEHQANVHMKVKRHRCPHCSEAFRNYFQRNKHIAAVHGLKLKEFKCTMCPKVFTISGKLGVHIRAVHLKLKRYSCDVCDWKFYSKSELKDHMVKHGGERKYQCSICKKAYARKYTLSEHMRIHANDRRFVCTICGRSFIQNCSLKHHMKIHHPNLVSDKIESFVS